jgi:hypothetical protein
VGDVQQTKLVFDIAGTRLSGNPVKQVIMEQAPLQGNSHV